VEIPYQRGDLVSRIMQTGIVESQDHNERGTVLTAKVDADLAADLQPYLLTK
jgi:GTP-binding protein HflX